MPSTYSTNLALELIGTGEQAGTWGTTTNTNLGTLIEQAVSGYVTQAVSTGTDTTITIPNGATGVARNMYIELTGTGGTNTNLIVPANKKLYFIFNNSTGAVTVKVSGQTGVSVPTGKKVVLTSNGTDIVNGLNYIADFGSNSATITQLTATSATITNLTLTSLVISNLSIASANITTLTSSSATISTTLALSGGNLAFTSTAQRLTADMSNSTVSNRFALQTSTTNGNTAVNSIPNGTSTTAQFVAYNNSDPNNASSIQLAALSTTTRLLAGQTGTGSYLPITFFTNGSEQARLDTAGNFGVGTSSPVFKFVVSNAGAQGFEFDPANGLMQVYNRSTSAYGELRPYASLIRFFTGTSPTETMRITSAGNIVAGASAALATTATDGFLYVPTCAGTPTGTPTAITGMAPIVVNTTNNKLYFYSGGAWRDAGP